MEVIHTFFEINRSILYFIYGLSFFVLGLATALQSRQYSRLDLARTLKWLAAFGLLHGIHEWGDVFIPIQQGYVSNFSYRMLHRLHLIILGVSFACLMEFGVALLRTLDYPEWLHVVPGGILALWFFFTFFPLTVRYSEFMSWHDTTNALARYFIGFPGSMLAAYALRAHAFQRIKSLHVPFIMRMLRFTGIGLFLYGMFSGLVTPAVPFFPGNVLNYATVERWLIFPVPVFRTLIGFGMTITVIRVLEIFDVEIDRMFQEMEQERIRAAERNRLSRELHDGVIQKVYTAGLLVESAHRIAETQPERVSNRLDRVESVLRDAVEDLRSNLVELYQPSREQSLMEALESLIEDPRFQTFIDIKKELEIPRHVQLSPMRCDHVTAIVHEALNNVIRHAQASQVVLSGQVDGDRLTIQVRDNGQGLPDDYEPGYGLRNMRDRARILGGKIKLHGGEDGGTRVTLEIPIEDDGNG